MKTRIILLIADCCFTCCASAGIKPVRLTCKNIFALKMGIPEKQRERVLHALRSDIKYCHSER